ncbi:MAG: virulence RhuM family protein [Firmicutes bacterium]|nr:virulence RhuM family protein [Bacillota bacterium]
MSKLVISNATAEFLVFAHQSGGDGVEVRIQHGTVWLTQKLLAQLFDSSIDNVALHLKNLYFEQELSEGATSEDFSVVQQEGVRSINRKIKHYNLDAIIAVGYRVNSKKATEFRRWATGVLHEFTLKGYVLDRKRMENGSFLDDDYFERLLEEIREIRLSERRFHQKITDIYSTAFDYDKDSIITKEFFAKIQNKLHWAIHGHTAAELVYRRADSKKGNMGLTAWETGPKGKIVKSDVVVAKNYLTETELRDLSVLVSAYLDLAERRAKSRMPMSMDAWAKHLDAILVADGNELLTHAGRISAEIAKEHAESEFEKFRVIQDRLFKSDFDKLLAASVKADKVEKEGEE